jgi:hypothetical protein
VLTLINQLTLIYTLGRSNCGRDTLGRSNCGRDRRYYRRERGGPNTEAGEKGTSGACHAAEMEACTVMNLAISALLAILIVNISIVEGTVLPRLAGSAAFAPNFAFNTPGRPPFRSHDFDRREAGRHGSASADRIESECTCR